MQLKISSITNLTDARYFAAIGADYIGFSFDVLNENNISLEKVKSIMSWLHDTAIVGEFGAHQTKEEIEFIAAQMELNDIQIPYNHPQQAALAFEKFLVLDNWEAHSNETFSDFLVLSITQKDWEHPQLKKFIAANNVFIETAFTKETISSLVENLAPFGIQLTAKKEEKAGWSFVDEYAELLEQIGYQ